MLIKLNKQIRGFLKDKSCPETIVKETVYAEKEDVVRVIYLNKGHFICAHDDSDIKEFVVFPSQVQEIIDEVSIPLEPSNSEGNEFELE